MITSSVRIVLLALVCATALAAQTFTTVVNFDGSNGQGPYTAVIQGTDDGLYGTTYVGGIFGLGTIFDMSSTGQLSTLFSLDNPEGYYPSSTLVQAANGSFYGTALYGGVNNDGTVFEITPEGKFTRLYSFCSQPHCTDGSDPFAGLVQGSNGKLYGTTSAGGAFGGGTVFEITTEGELTTLYNFCSVRNCADGFQPYAGLIQGENGNFYGTTTLWGAHESEGGEGTVFEMTPEGHLTTLHSFCALPNCADGNLPEAGLLQASDGNFYGTTTSGSANRVGTVFKISLAGAFTILYTFCSQAGCADGGVPIAGLIQGTDGNLYGAASQDGASNDGTVFQITTNGNLTTLHSFDGTDGESPAASVTQATSGMFYGTTYTGGSDNKGTIFSLSMGLGPFIETQLSAGSAGTYVVILGNNLTGSTAVSFNGTAAPFAVVSDTEISATVPAGATTGSLAVTTPGGTLTSNKVFVVIR
jgi:uncharacterized repeat protein (TIGR03803 family)